MYIQNQHVTTSFIDSIKENKGATASVIDDSIGGTKEFKIKIRKQLIKDGLVEVKKGPRNSDLYFAL